MVGYSSSLYLMTSVWEGKSSHRSALSQSRASGKPSVVLQTQGTGNRFETIIAKSFLSPFHLSQQQKGQALSSHKYLIPLDISSNKVLKYLGESGSETLTAGLHLCETVTTKVCVYVARSFPKPTAKACSSKLSTCQACKHHADGVNEILIPLVMGLHMVAHTTGF